MRAQVKVIRTIAKCAGIMPLGHEMPCDYLREEFKLIKWSDREVYQLQQTSTEHNRSNEIVDTLKHPERELTRAEAIAWVQEHAGLIV